jgi:tetratricopeptide (TPR) repeat protein
MLHIRTLCRVSALVTILGPQTVMLAGPGFGGIGGMRKKKIDLQTRQPALVRLANTSIAFTGSSTNPEYTPVQGSLLATLETQLIGNEKTLLRKNNPSEAEWVFNLKVTGFSVANPQQRTQSYGQTSATYTRWSGSLNVAYEVLDKAGRVHDAKNVDYTYDREFDAQGGSTGGWPKSINPFSKKSGSNDAAPHSTEAVKQILIHDVVLQIAANLGNTTRAVEVQIATGQEQLNRAADFMEQRLWSRALDELGKMEAFPKPEDESYRQYDLGLVYEAMAYDAATVNEQRANFLKAEECYDKALESNRKEKYFVETVARTRNAIARYKELDAMQHADQKKHASVVAKASPPQNPPVNAPPAPQSAPASSDADSASRMKPATKPLKTADVIEMFQAGVGEPEIVDMIHRSPVVDFNFMDKDTLVSIAKAHLPLTLQNEMRKKVGLAPLAAPAPVAAPAKPAPARKTAAAPKAQ